MAAKQSPKQSGKNPEKPTSALLQASTLYTALNHATHPELINPGQTAAQISVQDMLATELNAARLLNVSMTGEPQDFISILESRIQDITGTRKNVMLILDEESGTYTCLNDQKNSSHFAQAQREVTWISDTYLQDLLSSQQVLHSFLHFEGNIFGIVAIADKEDGAAFNLRDEIILEQLTQYLSVQVNHYLMLKRSRVLPTTQRILLEISNRLLCAIDSPAIFHGALSCLLTEMPFSAGQYVQLDQKTGNGNVLYELANDTFLQGESLHTVEAFLPLMSLFQSQVSKHSYLYLKGKMLADKPFSEIFGLPDIVSVLLLPIFGGDNQIKGAMVLFQQEEAITLSKDALKVAEQVASLVVSARDRARYLEKAMEIATTDELTGAVNRRGFYSRCDAEVDRARRNQTSLCMGIIDVDHFKMINDTYGHLAGDQVLKQLSAHIQKNIRKSDLLCRFGGEEFALLFPETSLKAAAELLERLRRKIEKLVIQTAAGPIRITISGGLDVIETAENFGKDALVVISESMAKADEALYQAKQLGRNRLIIVEQDSL